MKSTFSSSLEAHMSTGGKTTPEQNKAIVLKAFDTLFKRHNYEGAADFWSTNYLQHSAHIPPGRDGLFGLVRSLPGTLRYENGPIVAEGDYVFVQGRFSNIGITMTDHKTDVRKCSRGPYRAGTFSSN